MLRIVTDSAADMPQEWRQKYDIAIVPVNIHFGTEQFLHGVDMTEEEYYKRLETVNDKTFPKTSQPNPHQIEQVYRRVAQKGDTILSIHVTGKLSKTVESAMAARANVDGDYKVHVFDSLNGSTAMGLMCREAREMERAGKSMDDIIKRLEHIRDTASFVITLATLKYAQMSGRVHGIRALLGSVLNLKPVIQLNEGVLLPTEDKIRVRSKAFERLIELSKAKLGDRRVRMSVVHASAPDEAKTLADMVSKSFNCVEPVLIESLSIAIAIQLGPGTIAVLGYPE